ncbi:MAG: hypothetical protein HYV63_01145 [Candidatus Schekmanbacteria bacterium]|nr:hypothetical protein [Candidatus Schekmanbacteria bacterium]
MVNDSPIPRFAHTALRRIKEESYRWLLSYQRATELAQRCEGTRVVSVCDREGDIFELFDQT